MLFAVSLLCQNRETLAPLAAHQCVRCPEFKQGLFDLSDLGIFRKYRASMSFLSTLAADRAFRPPNDNNENTFSVRSVKALALRKANAFGVETLFSGLQRKVPAHNVIDRFLSWFPARVPTPFRRIRKK